MAWWVCCCGHELFACHRNQLFDSSCPGKGLEAMRQPGTPAGPAGLTGRGNGAGATSGRT
jgi:hypothetical protein